jgi:hypothetical protein
MVTSITNTLVKEAEMHAFPSLDAATGIANQLRYWSHTCTARGRVPARGSGVC